MKIWLVISYEFLDKYAFDSREKAVAFMKSDDPDCKPETEDEYFWMTRDSLGNWGYEWVLEEIEVQ